MTSTETETETETDSQAGSRTAGAQLAALDGSGRELLFTRARTANTFADTPVPDEQLAEIWELAKWAPTMANTQPLRVLYVRTPEGKARLVAHMADGNKAKVLAAPAVAVLALDTRFHEHIPTVFPVNPGLRDVFEANEEMRIGAATYSSALQAGYFILAVRAAGLAAGPMAGFNTDAINAEFFPDGRLRATLVVNIGHPGDSPWFDRLPRLDGADVVQWA